MPLRTTIGGRGASLSTRVATHFGLAAERVFALNDANAAAIAVAYNQTKRAEYLEETRARLALVLRIAGGVGAGIIIVEPPFVTDSDRESGFRKSAARAQITTRARSAMCRFRHP